MFSFSVSSVICGLHVYKVIWENTAPGEKLCYQHEVDNLHDPCGYGNKWTSGGMVEDDEPGWLLFELTRENIVKLTCLLHV